MIVLLIRNNLIHSITLPLNVYGNYWLTEKDNRGNEKNLVNIIEENGKWKVKSNLETKIIDENNKIVTENTKMKMVQEGIFEKPEKIYVKSTVTMIPMNEKQKEELGDMLEQSSELYFDGQR